MKKTKKKQNDHLLTINSSSKLWIKNSSRFLIEKKLYNWNVYNMFITVTPNNHTFTSSDCALLIYDKILVTYEFHSLQEKTLRLEYL